MAPEEVPGIPETSLEEIPPPTRTPTDPEKEGDALFLGMNAAGDAIEQSETLSDTALAVVIPMKGDGDRQCDRGFHGGKEIGLF